MTAPPKPWESGMNRMSSTRPLLESGPSWNGSVPFGLPQMSSSPPPLPTRRPVQSSYSAPYSNQMLRYGGYNSYMGFNPYGYNNPYGRRMMGMGMMPDDLDSRMMQVAEESCQALFGPLDSLVRGVSSIAMVLDSTMQAMQMSFRTVVSAADSLSRLKSLALELASGLSIFATIGNFFRRLFRMLGLMKGAGPAEKEWAAAAAKAAAAASASANKKGPSAWPAVAFFALMMGGPYLMFRMFSQFPQPAQAGSQGWIPSSTDSVNVTALYDFDPMNSGEMQLRRGDQLLMRNGSSSNGWVLVSDGTKSGYVPLNRLARHGKKQNVQVKKVVNPIPVTPPVQTAPVNKAPALSESQAAALRNSEHTTNQESVPKADDESKRSE